MWALAEPGSPWLLLRGKWPWPVRPNPLSQRVLSSFPHCRLWPSQVHRLELPRGMSNALSPPFHCWLIATITNRPSLPFVSLHILVGQALAPVCRWAGVGTAGQLDKLRVTFRLLGCSPAGITLRSWRAPARLAPGAGFCRRRSSGSIRRTPARAASCRAPPSPRRRP